MSTIMPTDTNDQPIPALRLKPAGSHHIAASTVSARNASAFADDTKIASLYATVPVFVKFGDVNVVATTSDHYFPAGLYYDFAIGGEKTAHYTHIAVLSADQAGDVYISEKE